MLSSHQISEMHVLFLGLYLNINILHAISWIGIEEYREGGFRAADHTHGNSRCRDRRSIPMNALLKRAGMTEKLRSVRMCTYSAEPSLS